MIVLAIIFVILTIVVALFTTGDVTRQALLRSHNELKVRQKMQYEMAWQLSAKTPPPFRRGLIWRSSFSSIARCF